MPNLTKIVCLEEDCNHNGKSVNSGSSDTYSKSEIDAKDDAVKSIAESAKSTADASQTKNVEQDSRIKELQKDSHTHENKSILDATEESYTTAEKNKLASLENYTHPTHTSHSKGMYKFANDGLGHVSDAEKVTKDDIVGLGIPGQDTTYTAGTGLSISGTTINHKNSVAAKTTAGFLKLKYDSQGHITGSSGVTKDDIVDLGIPGQDTNTEYIVLRGSVKTNHGYIGGVNSLLLVDKSNYDKENEVLTSTNDLSICDMNPYVTFLENNYMNPEYTAYPMFYDAKKSGEKSGIQSVISSGKIRINQNLDGFDVDGNITASKFIGANATKTEQGLMSAKDKTKLDNIADSANNYVHPTTSGNKHIPSGGSSGKILRWYADGTAVWGDDKDTTYSNATQSASGLMTAEDKTKLDGIAIGANKTVVDTALSSTSTNPVQNKVVKAALDGKAASSHTHSYLPLSGGTMTGNATVSKSSGDAGWYAERSDTGVAVWCGVGSGGANHGVYSRKLNKWMMYGDANGVYLNGNASTATKLKTARTMTIGSTGKSFDGSANVSWTLAEIGAAAASHTHTYLSNLNKSFTGANSAAKWIKLGTLVSSGDACYTIIRVFSGDGFNSLANQNASFEIHIKDGWQSTGSAKNSCGVTVYRINCSSIKVQVRASSSTTYDVWCYLPWGYWNGNYSVYGRYNTWTHAGTNQSEEPTSGTTQSLSYYDYVFGNDSRLHTHSTKSTNYGTLTASSNQLSLTSAVGMHTSGKTYTHNNTSYTGSAKSEVFNDYTNNMAAGDYAHVEGSENKGLANCTHVEGWKNVASGNQAHAEGQYCKATGEAAHAQNTSTTASGDYSHAEGWLSQASGVESHAGGYDSKANGQGSFVHGFQCTATTPWSVSMGSQCTSANSNCAFTFGWNLTNLIGNSTVVGQWNAQSKEGFFVVGKGTSSAKANAFRVASDGKTYATGAYSSTGADYAEMFEWMDGNPDEEDRRGHFVTLDGEKIKFAESADDDIIGVVSAAASIVGDAYEDNWNGMYLTDIFGGNLYDKPIIDEDGNKHVYQTLNPDYDPDVIYVPRSERPEWDAVGMMGKLVVIDDGTCKVNEYCIPTTGGIATASSGRIGYRVLARIDDTHVKILMR
ncbi:peptidase G2 autoproteolytic cleavage domain-containing protein [uncultured Ruminococcus sp.]|uniref:peptidase G2 autoproteolytic cleavage domain-containing protein n=1 Tax=uncultured Ruminococcus sp. TaxID=165186 RepID=UPI00260370B1|nr:peptidase G2 autoproteolytic cleavage domain-containing protein [uncultured Ruminococcus sp.]